MSVALAVTWVVRMLEAKTVPLLGLLMETFGGVESEGRARLATVTPTEAEPTFEVESYAFTVMVCEPPETLAVFQEKLNEDEELDDTS